MISAFVGTIATRPSWLIWPIIVIISLVTVALVVDRELWDLIIRNRSLLIRGAINTWLYAIGSIVAGMIAGTIVAGLRCYGPLALRVPLASVVECLRATPQLVIILWVYFVVPEVTGVLMSPQLSGLIGLSVIASVYLSEVVRSGLMSVPHIQRETAFTTGLSPYQSFYYVIFPQALRNMVPALVATFVMIFKTTTLLHVLGVGEFFHYAYIINIREIAPYEIYGLLAAYYFVCCALISLLVRRLDSRI